MLIHILIISLQCAAIASFLILWYFWVKKKLETAYLVEDEREILFPFRYFSWLLIGLVLVTSIAQIHFVRVSSQVHERMAAIAASSKPNPQQARALDELKGMIEKVRRDMESNFKVIRAQLPDKQQQARALQTIADVNTLSDRSVDKEGLLRIEKNKLDSPGNVFAKEAKSSSSSVTATEASDRHKSLEESSRDQSMRLSRNGKILKDQVNVRQRPQTDSTAVDRLMTGQQVKVTEKRLDNEGKIWFRIITPSGRAGWIDFRFVKLEGNA
jgi:hypothetical protein